MAHLGLYTSTEVAKAAWLDLVAQVPLLNDAQPVIISGFIPSQGDIVRLYARMPEDRLIDLCDAVNQVQPASCEIHQFMR
jgi:hypothetical protein